MARGQRKVDKGEDGQNVDDGEEMDVEEITRTFGGKKQSSPLKDVNGNLIMESVQNKGGFGNKDTTLNAMSIESLQKSERRGSCFFVNDFPLDIIQVVGKLVNKTTVFDNRVTFFLSDDCTGALNSLMCTFWKVNTVNFEKHVILLSKKHVRVTGVLDFDDRVILNVYSISPVNNVNELTYHALQVKFHAMNRALTRNALQPISQNFNQVEDLLPKPHQVAIAEHGRFDVTPEAVQAFLAEMVTSKVKKFHFDKVVVKCCFDSISVCVFYVELFFFR